MELVGGGSVIKRSPSILYTFYYIFEYVRVKVGMQCLCTKLNSTIQVFKTCLHITFSFFASNNIVATLARMSNMSEKLCLNWNDFQKNVFNTYQDLRKDVHFADVTLVCEEDHNVEANRIILTACSPSTYLHEGG